jgi:tetratricopeptide (TPR) repeat protein
MADIGCTNCEINEGQSKPSLVYGGKTKTNISTCQLLIEIDKLSPGGIYAGTLFIDPLYEPINDEVITFCEWESKYYGSYIYSQLGKTYKEQINGEIEVEPEVYFNKGINYRKNGLDEKFTPDLELSILCFNKAIKLGKNDSETWNEMGISFYYLGKLSEAIFCFNEALNLDSQFKTSHYNIGIIFIKLGNFEAATGYAKKALLIDENFEDAKSLIEICESINPFYLPEGFPRDSIANLNEEEGTLFFTMNEGNLQDHSLEEVIIFDFNKGGSRYILVRDANFNLVYSHCSIQTGFRVAKINLKNVTLNPEKVTITITWSENENKLYLSDINSGLISERAVQLNDTILTNALEQQPFFEFDGRSYFQPMNNFTFNIISVT